LHLPLLLFLLLSVLFHSNPKTVISTEAAHSLIVSSAAEKSASLPQPFLSPDPHLHFQLPVNGPPPHNNIQQRTSLINPSVLPSVSFKNAIQSSWSGIRATRCGGSTNTMRYAYQAKIQVISHCHKQSAYALNRA
jgi:hypothetical protein